MDAFVDLVKHLLDQAGSNFRRQHFDGHSTVKAPLDLAEPARRGLPVPEDLVGEDRDSGDPDGSVGFVGRQALMVLFAVTQSVVKKSLAFGSVYFFPVLARPNRPLRRLGGPPQARLSHCQH